MRKRNLVRPPPVALFGITDSDGRSFDHKNLFVAGSSVFATGAPTNPTITVAALALRTAKAIEQQLAKGDVWLIARSLGKSKGA